MCLLKYVSRRSQRKNADAEVKQYGCPKHEVVHHFTNTLKCYNGVTLKIGA